MLAAGCCTGGRRAGGQGDRGQASREARGQEPGKNYPMHANVAQKCVHKSDAYASTCVHNVCTQSDAYASTCAHKVVCTEMCAQECVHSPGIFWKGFLGSDFAQGWRFLRDIGGRSGRLRGGFREASRKQRGSIFNSRRPWGLARSSTIKEQANRKPAKSI